MKFNIIASIVTLAAGVRVRSHNQSQSQGSRADMLLSMFDSNNNGKISREEYTHVIHEWEHMSGVTLSAANWAALYAEFDSCDTNHDNEADVPEIEAWLSGGGGFA